MGGEKIQACGGRDGCLQPGSTVGVGRSPTSYSIGPLQHQTMNDHRLCTHLMHFY